jgi:urease alpha subunit
MEKLDTKLVNGTLASSEGEMKADIGILEGKIAAVDRTGGLPDAREVIDIRDKVVPL